MIDEKTRKEAETTLWMAQKAEETSAFNAVILYRRALALLKPLNDAEKIKLCLSKIRELNKEAQKSFKRVEAKHKISDDVIEGVMKAFREAESLEEMLILFAFHPDFLIDYDQTVDRVVNSPFIARKICTHAVVNEKGDFVNGGSDGDRSEVMQYYFLHDGIVSQVFLSRAWELLLERGLTVEILVQFFQKRLGLDEELVRLLENGFSHLFFGDSIAALHVLVPRFEQIVLILAQGLGLDVVALERGQDVATRDKMVGDRFMRTPEVQEKFGKNFCEEAAFFLFDPLGVNLRHHLAHGDVQLRHCDFPHALSMLRLLLTFPTRFHAS